MLDAEIRQQFLTLQQKVNSLSFSIESIVELGSIKFESERMAGMIKDEGYRSFCLNEIEQVNTDEFHDMYTLQREADFKAAKNEFLYILMDCHRGHL